MSSPATQTPAGNATTTIVAAATPRGHGGIAIVRLSGPRALTIAERIFHGSQRLGDSPRLVQYGHFLDANQGRIDTGLAWYMQGPRSYTGEDTVEFSSHGSELVVELLLDAALAHGATTAQPGEFTRRAFLNGRLDLLQAEAVLDVIQAGTRQDLSNALGATSGRLSQQITHLREMVLAATVQVEADIDFADEDIDPASRQHVSSQLTSAMELLENLRQGYDGARERGSGWMVLLTGPANVGKSTLLNALAHEERAIVSATPGTTRDWIDARVIWGGELLRLVDSAGLRVSADEVEEEGVRRTQALAKEASVVAFVVDGSQGWPCEDANRTALGLAQILVLNKCDLGVVAKVPEEVQEGKVVVEISARTGEGLERLQEALMSALPRSQDRRQGIFRKRHDELLSGCEASLGRALHVLAREPEKAAADLQESLRQLASLLGEEVEDMVLDRIFQEFCIGK
ncbi:MAG: tRNA uridine-5-carboxymethylaminomethyl(34) synthesis GTPase MnmE [Gemmatimonadetes bacterium]|nr:tRNA uridine-5-carboxymethylaminomethyl(34) synthesis GTPase MnmE [Gemmatimonadota bacterium]